MGDPLSDPDNGAGRDPQSIVGTPIWVKVFGIIALAVILVLVVVLLAGRGHGPGRHTGVGPGQTAPASVISDRVHPAGYIGGRAPWEHELG
jgi:hypothetical protein